MDTEEPTTNTYIDTPTEETTSREIPTGEAVAGDPFSSKSLDVPVLMKKSSDPETKDYSVVYNNTDSISHIREETNDGIVRMKQVAKRSLVRPETVAVDVEGATNTTSFTDVLDNNADTSSTDALPSEELKEKDLFASSATSPFLRKLLPTK